MSNRIYKYKDIDPDETQEWLDAFSDILHEEGDERARYILDKMIDFAERKGDRMFINTNTPFINTIQHFEQQKFPGNRKIETEIKSIIRWNAMAMVVRANKEVHGIGGHISTYASAATLYEIGFNHFFKGNQHPDGPDIIYFQGHASPGIYARAFFEGRFNDEHLNNFRRETTTKKGLSSYPHPWLMPDFWQYATVSMGLSPIMAIYQARFMRYLEDRKLKNRNSRKVWAFLGDGEMDEPESLGAISLAKRENLNNLIFVINCNLQRLDGPVRGNGKIIQELEGTFRGAGWNVIKIIWGSEWDTLIDQDNSGKLAQRMEEIVDGDLLKYQVEGGAYMREHFFGKYPETLELVKSMSDNDISNLTAGGHDPEKVYSAYYEATNEQKRPTVILARTIKGYGLGEAGEGRNITHQQKELNQKELLEFKNRFNIPISDKDAMEAPFYKPTNDSQTFKYLKKIRKNLGGPIPERLQGTDHINIPNIDIFSELLEGYKDREISTTMAFVRILTILCKDKYIGNKIVPIIPDEARTFGIDPLFRQIGIYNHAGQLYEPVDSEQFLYYKEAKNGQILEEGLTEAGSMSSFIAAATSYSSHNKTMVPFYIFYSMFGFQRVWDFIWAASDMRARGFLIGGTAGRTTLNGEGLQHQDGHSHIAAACTPNIKSYDLAYSYELAVVIQAGLKEMYKDNIDIIYYLTVENENYKHPKMKKGIEKDIIKGMYQIKSANEPIVRILGSGPILNEAIEASRLLKEDWSIDTSLWNVTSFNELRRDAESTDRFNLLADKKKYKKSYIQQCFKRNNIPTIAVSDYVKMHAEQISKHLSSPYYALGTDGFGRSDTRENLRSFFEIDRYYITLYSVVALVKQKKIKNTIINDVISKYNLEKNKKNPINI